MAAGADRLKQDRQRLIVAHHVEDAEDANDAQDEDGFEHCPVVLETVVFVRQLEDDLQAQSVVVS